MNKIELTEYLDRAHAYLNEYYQAAKAEFKRLGEQQVENCLQQITELKNRIQTSKIFLDAFVVRQGGNSPQIDNYDDIALSDFFVLFRNYSDIQSLLDHVLHLVDNKSVINHLRISLSTTIIEHMLGHVKIVRNIANTCAKDFNVYKSAIFDAASKYASDPESVQLANDVAPNIELKVALLTRAKVDQTGEIAAVLGETEAPPCSINNHIGSSMQFSIDLLVDPKAVFASDMNAITPAVGIQEKVIERFRVLTVGDGDTQRFELSKQFVARLNDEIKLAKLAAELIERNNQPEIDPDSLLAQYRIREQQMIASSKSVSESRIAKVQAGVNPVNTIPVKTPGDLVRLEVIGKIARDSTNAVAKLRKERQFIRDRVELFDEFEDR